MTQILANAGGVTLTKTWYLDGNPTDVDDVTIGIVDGNSDEVVESGTATSNEGSGVYTYSLANQPNPNHLIVTWTDVDTGDTRVDRIEVIGNWLFSVAAARKFAAKADATDAVVPLKSESEYPDSTITDERQRITDDLENWTHRAWIPRYARVELSGSNGYELDLSSGFYRTADGFSLHRPGRLADISTVLSVTVGDTTINADNVKIDSLRGRLRRTDSTWTGPTVEDPYNVVVEYVYGLPYIADGVDRVAMRELVDRLVPSTFTDRALTVDSEYGTVRLVNQGGPMRNVSRIPMVNEWVAAHDNKILLG